MVAPTPALAADPFASLPSPAPAQTDTFVGLATTVGVADPVIELEVLDLTEAAIAELATPEFMLTPIAAVPAAAAPSWGDLLDIPAPPPLATHDLSPAIELSSFATVPVSADAIDVYAPPRIAAPPPLDEAACPRCANARVVAARFCPFCGLSFVGVPLASGVVPVQSEFSGHADLDIDINEPSGPVVRFGNVAPAEHPLDAVGFAPMEVSTELPREATAVTPVDDKTFAAPPLELSADEIGLAAVVEPLEAVEITDVLFLDTITDDQAQADAAASLAAHWADAAEKQIPRKESDRRNDLGWVPPSRELVVTLEVPPPAPEPVVAYTPAAPPVVTGPAAPWALFAPTLSLVEAKSESQPPATTDDAWDVSSLSGAVSVATVEKAPAQTKEAAAPALFAPSIVDEQSLDLDISELAAAGDTGEPLEMSYDVIDMTEEPIALPPLTVPAAEMFAPSLPPVIGWGDAVDAPAPPPVLPAVALPSISVAFVPPATLTPPPMVLTRTPTFDGIVAPAALSEPLLPQPPSSPMKSHDDPFATAVAPPVAAAPTAKAQKVTATMVMKLDPAEQRRLLEMLLANTEISADVLSQLPALASGEPDKGS